MVKSPISQKRLSFPKCGCGKISVNRTCVKFNLALSRSNIHKSITGRMVVLVDSVSINPVLSTIKLLRWFIICQEAAVMPAYIAWELHLSELHKPVRRSLIESIYRRLPSLQYLARVGWPLKDDGNEIDSNFAQLLLLCGNQSWSKDGANTAA